MTRPARSVIAATAVLTLLLLGAPAGAEHGNPGDIQIISRPTGLDPVPTPTTNDSYLNTAPPNAVVPPGRTVSGDGKLVVFASDADGLSTEDNNRVHNIFVRNVDTHQTTLVSRATGVSGAPADGDSYAPTISKDGTTVAFVTQAANLGDGVTVSNLFGHVYLRNLSSQTTNLVTRASNSGVTPGAPGIYGGDQPSISADGNLVAFATYTGYDSTNDTGSFTRDIYVRNVSVGTTTLVSRADGATGAVGNGGSQDPCISSDGTRIAFDSFASNLVAADANTARDAFVRVLGTGATLLASRADGASGAVGDDLSVFPTLNDDGTKVVFVSQADNLVSGISSSPGSALTYLRNTGTGTTTLVSRASNPSNAKTQGAWQYPPQISYDGSAVAFVGAAGAVDPTLSGYGLFVRTLGTSTTELVGRANGPTGAEAETVPTVYALSSDANVVAFESTATNLGASTDVDFRGIYVRNRAAGTTVSAVKPDGSDDPFASPGINSSYQAPGGISADGRYVVFSSQADWLSSEDDNRWFNVFVRDTVTDKTTLVSRASGAAGAAANSTAIAAGISADGTKVLFASDATNLVGDLDYTRELYIRNLVTNQTTRVTPFESDSGMWQRDVNGITALARLSADGTKVAFATYISLDPVDTGFDQDVYVMNADGTGSPVLASRATGASGAEENGGAEVSGMTPDGSRVVFDSSADNLTPDDPPGNTNQDVFVRDLNTNQTILVSRANGAAGTIGDGTSYGGGISADGNRVAFTSYSGNLTSDSTQGFFVRDLAAGTTTLVSRDSGAAGDPIGGGWYAPATISADGTRVAFSATIPVLVGSTNQFFGGVFVRDLSTNTTYRVSHVAGGTDNADGSSYAPAISANGDCVAFESNADDLVPADAGGTDFPFVYLATISRECPAVPPHTTLTSGPTGPTNTRQPAFTFENDDPSAELQCKLDGEAFAACISPYTAPSLGDGPHTFTVRSVDPAGYSDPTPPSRSFVVDTVPPTVTITGGPAAPSKTRAASFSWSASEAATFQCSIDGGPATACSSPRSYSGLADGSHHFTVAGTDDASNHGSAAARTWSVDTVPPSVTITSGPTGLVKTRTASFRWTASEAATFKCSLDRGAVIACSSPRSYNGLVDGSHQLTVVGTDRAGNHSSAAARAWSVDATAPGGSVAVPKQKLGTVLRKGLRIKLGATETVTYALTVEIAGSTRLFAKRSGSQAAGQAGLTIRPLAGAKKLLRKRRSATLIIKLIDVDAAGNPSSVVTRRVKLKR